MTDSDDIKNVDLSKVHNLSGPIAVEGAEPGDCLVVDILDGSPISFSLELTKLNMIGVGSDSLRQNAVGIHGIYPAII